MQEYEVINADCSDAMAAMEPDSVDAIVTDPPYGIAFMGAKWDSFNGGSGRQTVDERKAEGKRYADENKGAPRYGNSHGKRVTRDEMVAFQDAMTPVFREALRVAKPGAYLLCFGGTRTFHRMACAIEDAGWSVKDCIMWVYGSGFPHGMNIEKAFERANDHDNAKRWHGWNTQLKPSWEPVIVAQKQFIGTITNNVVTYGTGAINVDACRIGFESRTYKGMSAKQPEQAGVFRDDNWVPKDIEVSVTGRYPANLVHDGSDEVVELFPDTGKSSGGGGFKPSATGGVYGTYAPKDNPRNVGIGDSGSAARFFYCAKASKKDRGVGNDHPTCKPTALMQWLVRLVCRRGGVVLDPFCGSGSTGVACMREGMRFVGVEREEHYCDIARERISKACDECKQQSLPI